MDLHQEAREEEQDGGSESSMQEEEFLGNEGRELLSVLKETESSAKRNLPLPNWVRDLPGKGLGDGNDLQPFLLPLGEQLDQKLRKWTKNDRLKDMQQYGSQPITAGKLRLDRQKRKKTEAGNNSLNALLKLGDVSEQTKPTQERQTARQYLWETLATAKERNLISVTEEGKRKAEEQLKEEQEHLKQYEEQILKHEKAFDSFLAENYERVSKTLKRHTEVRSQIKEQEGRLEYYSGVLQEYQAQLKEELEKLDEVTRYKEFLWAVTPQQSIADLKASLPYYNEVKESSVNANDLPGMDKRKKSSDIGNSQNCLEEEIKAMRMLQMRESPNISHNSQIGSSEDLNSKEEITEANIFDQHLDNPEYLQNLAKIYENQCFTLMSLLTRLNDQVEATTSDMKKVERENETKLQELRQLGGSVKSCDEVQTIEEINETIESWPTVAKDENVIVQIEELQKQVSELVSDVFSHNEHVPLIARRVKSGASSPKLKVFPSSGDLALLTLLEARFTDICSQLDAIQPEFRDKMFLNCERERRQIIHEKKKLDSERLRQERRNAHLERATCSPPPKPI